MKTETLNQKEIISLIALLDDEDYEILNHVEQKLMQLGKDVIPFLENEWQQIQNSEHQQRVENIIHNIQFNDLLREFKQWQLSEDKDLLQGVYLVSKYRFPELDKQKISNAIDELKMSVWLEMKFELTPFEKIRILNYVLFIQNKFIGNIEKYHDPSNSFVNQVLETRQGNPIMLSIIYILVAQRLNIPVFGINLPQHFMLAYLEEDTIDISSFNYGAKPTLQTLKPQGKPILFYINAFNKGGIFTRESLEQFLKQIRIEHRIEFFEPCNNVEIIKRVLRNLVAAYEKQNNPNKQREVQEILFALGEPDINHFEDVTNFGDE